MFRRAKLHLADVDPATLARAAAGRGPGRPPGPHGRRRAAPLRPRPAAGGDLDLRLTACGWVGARRRSGASPDAREPVPIGRSRGERLGPGRRSTADLGSAPPRTWGPRGRLGARAR